MHNHLTVKAASFDSRYVFLHGFLLCCMVSLPKSKSSHLSLIGDSTEWSVSCDGLVTCPGCTMLYHPVPAVIAKQKIKNCCTALVSNAGNTMYLYYLIGRLVNIKPHEITHDNKWKPNVSIHTSIRHKKVMQ